MVITLQELLLNLELLLTFDFITEIFAGEGDFDILLAYYFLLFDIAFKELETLSEDVFDHFFLGLL